jgi:hypothetical protein
MEQTFYKMDIQGIVYLVDPTKGTAYTYDIKNPLAIGKVIWENSATAPRIELFTNWLDLLTAKRQNVTKRSPTITAPV